LGTAAKGPVMRPILFTPEDRRALAHDRYHHPDPRVQRKMEVLWLKSHGLDHDDIATYAGVSRRTVQRYLDQYLEGVSMDPNPYEVTEPELLRIWASRRRVVSSRATP
jgi:transcriptional regulator GlxA family with amidase domain